MWELNRSVCQGLGVVVACGIQMVCGDTECGVRGGVGCTKNYSWSRKPL